MSTDDPVQPGDVLSGKFRVERVLGVGGMGVVVAATHLQLGQLVALKFMLKQALQYPDNIARFEREARAAVRLRSDHVAKVVDVGRLDGDDGVAGGGPPYMVMEFLDGEDLDVFMREKGPLPVQLAVDFLLQACEAIAEAHALGIVHRDLKPKNLFLTHRLNGEPLVKVLDFGVSKIVGQGDELSLTATTQVLGSPSYMSPEQLRASRDVDQRTDIWALGAILYELLTGTVPFPAHTLTQLTAMVISDPPRPIESLRTDLPPELRAIILRCLEKKVDDRYQSVSDLALVLAQFASPSSSSLATHRVSGGLGTSSSSRLSAIRAPSDRPSIRTPGSNTDVAWDKTELAAPRRKVLPIAVFVGLAAAIVGAIVFVKLVPHGSSTPAATTMTATTTAPAVTVTTTVTVTVTATAPVTAPPTVTAPATTTAATIARPAHARDAGAHPVSSGGLDLPSTRN
jgi:serine/threonine-protein kinase